MYLRAIVFGTFLLGTQLWAQTPETTLEETMVVSANRHETAADQVGSTVTVITGEAMAAAGWQQVTDALKTVPGLDVAANGGPGKSTSLFIRGSESTHCLVILDGVELNDVSSAGNAFDFGHLTVDDIERIEVVRGPQSPLYGSDAMSGVVRIFTRKGGGAARLNASLEGGSFGTQKQTLSYGETRDRFHYRIAASHFEQDGYSAADEEVGNPEKDGYNQTQLNLQTRLKATSFMDLGLSGRWQTSDSDLDNSGGPGGDDPNYTAENERTHGRLFADFEHGPNWEHQLGVSYSDSRREYLNEVDERNPGSSFSTFNGQKMKVDWQHQWRLNNQHLTAGAETEEEKADTSYQSDAPFGPYSSIFQEQTARTSGVYLQDHLQAAEHLSFTLGTRYDDHDRFGSKATWRGSAAWRPAGGNTLVRGSAGTAFKAPSLFQLYSSYGDENLKPEEVLGWDLGVEQTIPAANLMLQATWFQNDYEQLIDFDNSLFLYNNIAEAETRGLEFTLQWQAGPFHASANLTDMTTEDGETGLRLTRRPDQKANLQAGWRQERGHVMVQARYAGDRDFEDFSTFPTSLVTLGGYTVWNLAGGFTIGQHVGLRAVVENLFNKQYQEVLGYGTPGTSGRLSIHLNY